VTTTTADTWKRVPTGGTFELYASPDAKFKAPGRRIHSFTHGGHPMIRVAGTEFFQDQVVALAYLGRPPYGSRLIHRDGDWKNIHPSNLAYVWDDDDEFDAMSRLMKPSPPCRCPDDWWCGCRPYIRRVRPPKADGHHGRVKFQETCRKGHPLSMTGQRDANTAVWGTGNRICLTCTT
jgi:hypothetical protein